MSSDASSTRCIPRRSQYQAALRSTSVTVNAMWWAPVIVGMVPPLAAAERQLLPAMLRAGALRFWISRLWDFHLPREASMLKPHDPTHFERVLRGRATHPHAMAQALEPLLAA